jgi:hypothetical protein
MTADGTRIEIAVEDLILSDSAAIDVMEAHMSCWSANDSPSEFHPGTKLRSLRLYFDEYS